MRVILIAPPGAGKGTQGARIAERYGVPHIASGNLFRMEVARRSELGVLVQTYLDAGDLVPDELVTDLLRGPVVSAARAGGGYVLDGFPRTLSQARGAAEIAAEVGLEAQSALHLDAPEPVLVERMATRAQRRTDDSVDTARHRLEVYAEKTRPLLDFYAGRGILHTVDATPPIDDVSSAIFAILDELR